MFDRVKVSEGDYFFNWEESQTCRRNGVEYTFDEHGFRNSHKYSETDVLALGCSDTLGVGNHYQDIWPSLISKHISKPITNLGIAGGSIKGCYRVLDSYIKKQYPVKTVLLCIPSKNRTEVFATFKGNDYYQIVGPNFHKTLTNDHNSSSQKEIINYFQNRFELEFTNDASVNIEYDAFLFAIKFLCIEHKIDLKYIINPIFDYSIGPKHQKVYTYFNKFQRAADGEHFGKEYQKYISDIFITLLEKK